MKKSAYRLIVEPSREAVASSTIETLVTSGQLRNLSDVMARLMDKALDESDVHIQFVNSDQVDFGAQFQRSTKQVYNAKLGEVQQVVSRRCISISRDTPPNLAIDHLIFELCNAAEPRLRLKNLTPKCFEDRDAYALAVEKAEYHSYVKYLEMKNRHAFVLKIMKTSIVKCCESLRIGSDGLSETLTPPVKTPSFDEYWEMVNTVMPGMELSHAENYRRGFDWYQTIQFLLDEVAKLIAAADPDEQNDVDRRLVQLKQSIEIIHPEYLLQTLKLKGTNNNRYSDTHLFTSTPSNKMDNTQQISYFWPLSNLKDYNLIKDESSETTHTMTP